MGITHSKVSAKSDGGDATLIRPTDWNEEHVISGLSVGFIGATANRNATQAIPTGASYTAIAFAGTDDFDTDGFHDPTTNNSRMTIPAGLGGKYLVVGRIVWTNIAGGERLLCIRVNGSQSVWQTWLLPTVSYYQHTEVTGVLNLNAGDYVDLACRHDQGANVNLLAEGAFSIVKLDSGKVGSGIGAKAYNAATQAVTSGVEVALVLAAEEFDTDGFHSNSTNNSRMTVPAGLGGKYLLHGYTYTAALGSVQHLMRVKVNGSLVRGVNWYNTDSSAQVSTVLDLVAGDYAEVTILPGATGNISHGSALEAMSTVSIMRLDSGSAGTFSGARGVAASQAIGNAAWTAVAMSSESFDEGNWHDNSTNNSRFTVPGGVSYARVTATMSFVANATGDRYIRFDKNGSQYTGSFARDGNSTEPNGTQLQLADVIPVVAGDYLEVKVYQDSGGNLNVSGTAVVSRA